MVAFAVLYGALIVLTITDAWSVQTFLREIIIFSKEEPNQQDASLKNSTTGNRREFAPGIVTYECLDCLCRMESGCEPIGCEDDGSCGYFRIKENYWHDCGQLGSDWRTCANNITCSSECVQRYMERYARQRGCSINCEGFAREHDGGCTNPATIPFWNKLQDLEGCRGVRY